jgi:D-amino-acid oxidase
MAAGGREALVIGGGVSGLTTAVMLAEAGWRVRLWTAVPPERTTSAVAAAIWYPYRAFPADRVLAWGSRSLALFGVLADDPATGVGMIEGLELSREPMPLPWWGPAVGSLRRATAAELPPGYGDGVAFTVPVIEMPVYLAYLVTRLRSAGGIIQQRRITTLAEAREACPLIVNCAGLGAAELTGDASLFPIRGQVLRVANPGLTRFLLDDHHPEGVTYVVPRSRDVVLGGTAQLRSADLRPDPDIAASILRRCTALEPALRGAEVVGHAVGLRPGRQAVRLEAERLSGGGVCVHNYGHGGAGVTLSWGCAAAALELVMAAGLGR